MPFEQLYQGREKIANSRNGLHRFLHLNPSYEDRCLNIGHFVPGT